MRGANCERTWQGDANSPTTVWLLLVFKCAPFMRQIVDEMYYLWNMAQKRQYLRARQSKKSSSITQLAVFPFFRPPTMKQWKSNRSNIFSWLQIFFLNSSIRNRSRIDAAILVFKSSITTTRSRTKHQMSQSLQCLHQFLCVCVSV